MSLGKKDISKNISTKTHSSFKLSEQILNTFIDLLKKKSLESSVKISKFGTFNKVTSAERIGRNPLSKKEFLIKKRSKIAFKSSNVVKKFLN
jgi:nucleoid DNA-binding protein